MAGWGGVGWSRALSGWAHFWRERVVHVVCCGEVGEAHGDIACCGGGGRPTLPTPMRLLCPGLGCTRAVSLLRHPRQVRQVVLRGTPPSLIAIFVVS